MGVHKKEKSETEMKGNQKLVNGENMKITERTSVKSVEEVMFESVLIKRMILLLRIAKNS
jgi:hypothetical protein